MNRLREMRFKAGLNQAQLAKKLNCTDVTISRYELSQRRLDDETINKICDIFGCTSDYLLGRSDMPSTQLSKEEEDLLIAWRGADDHARRMVDLALEPFKKEDAGQKAI